ncbi:MAG: aminotransferase class V-fold PLP-dependent enzyme [Phycisphaerales bacterium]|nr:aminotransferase class V-fold PLP-dependent enzyme [Phycisphaerales bacterium]
MNNRREFIKQVGLMTTAFATNSLFNKVHAKDFENINEQRMGANNVAVAKDEDYWSFIQQAYTVNPEIIELNNGGVSPSPRIVQEAVESFNKLSNQGPSYYMWRILDQGREPLRAKLAKLAGCDAHEIAINRNATEALNTIIYGLDLQAGDEVVGTQQDYPNMMQAWQQRARREGIVYKQLSFDFPIENDDIIVASFEKALTPKTKILHITHIINWVGQIMPVKKICAMAKKYGVETVVDGAHSFALLDFTIPELGCDYFGTSLHKFLSAPIGTGMLWIKKENIEKIWPLLCNGNPKSSDIRKFETLGTRSFPIEQGIGEAINFHTAIGNKRKEERMRYLKDYWATQVKDLKGVKLHTSLKPTYSCAICGISIEGITPNDLNAQLFDDYKIHASAMVYANINCVRITPQVYTRLADLDKLVDAITTIAKRG